MGLLSFMGWQKRAKAPSDDFWYSMPGQPSVSGVNVSEQESLKYLTVYACVSLIAGDIGRLPLNLYRDRPDGGKDLVKDHPLYDILHFAPNPETTSFNWRETSQGHLLLWGNHYSWIERSKTGQVIGLWLLPNPGAVNVRRRGNQIIYEYKSDGKDVVRTRDEIFHVPGYGFNGLHGMSMINLSREAIGMGLAAEEFGGRFYGQGTHPAGIIEMDGELGDNKDEFIKNIKENYSGLGKSHSVMLMQMGAKYKPLTMNMDDAQFLESRTFQKSEIAGMYHVPLHKIGVHGANSNYNNLEQENAAYINDCLTNWTKRWEQSICLQLLTPAERKQGLKVEFQLQALLRGDSQARAEFYNKLFQIGSITPNEIRALENQNPIEGGDQSFVQLNLVPLDQAGEVDMTEPEKEPEEPTKPEFESYFSEKRASKTSVRIRDRINRQYFPLIEQAAKRIIIYEKNSINNQIKRSQRDSQTLSTWLDDFYKSLPKKIKREIGPVFQSFAAAIMETTAEMLDTDPIDIDDFVMDYIKSYSGRHIGTSRKQLFNLIEDEFDADKINDKMDYWADNRPEIIARNETVRESNAVFQAVVFAAGLACIWQIRGPKTCPYCTSLQNKKIRRGENFVADGEFIKLKGQQWMKINGMKAHPPLHAGCDCYISAI